MKGKERILEELISLYKNNVSFLMSIETGACKKKYSKKTAYEYEKLNDQLKDYIQDIKEGKPCDKDNYFWCELFGDILLDDNDESEEGLDDDNFPLGGKW